MAGSVWLTHRDMNATSYASAEVKRAGCPLRAATSVMVPFDKAGRAKPNLLDTGQRQKSSPDSRSSVRGGWVSIRARRDGAAMASA